MAPMSLCLLTDGAGEHPCVHVQALARVAVGAIEGEVLTAAAVGPSPAAHNVT